MPPLRRLRRLKGWSLRDLAREAGAGVDTVLDLEHRARRPRPSTMRKIAAALGVDIAEVDEFREDDVPAPPDQPDAGLCCSPLRQGGPSSRGVRRPSRADGTAPAGGPAAR